MKKRDDNSGVRRFKNKKNKTGPLIGPITTNVINTHDVTNKIMTNEGRLR
jgi:hypothetical protein